MGVLLYKKEGGRRGREQDREKGLPADLDQAQPNRFYSDFQLLSSQTSLSREVSVA